MTPEERYLHDPLFNKLVDWIEKFIHDSQYAPIEIRDAAALACLHHEQRQPRYNYPAIFNEEEDTNGDTKRHPTAEDLGQWPDVVLDLSNPDFVDKNGRKGFIGRSKKVYIEGEDF